MLIFNGGGAPSQVDARALQHPLTGSARLNTRRRCLLCIGETGSNLLAAWRCVGAKDSMPQLEGWYEVKARHALRYGSAPRPQVMREARLPPRHARRAARHAMPCRCIWYA